MKKIKTKLIQLLIVFTLGVLVFNACKKDEEAPTAPELPPVESMVVDFSTFNGSSTKSYMMSDAAGTDSTIVNFVHAAGSIFFWNVLLTATLIVPVTSYQVALSHSPVYMGDNAWQWSFDYKALFADYTARLVGTLNSDKSINWEMYITKIGILGFSEVLWFDGKTNAGYSSGDWTLYEKLPGDSTTIEGNATIPVLQIDWVKEGSEIGSVTYTSIKEGIDFKDSYLIYGVQEGDYNAYYNIHYWDFITNKFWDVEIEWDIDTKYGHVMAEKKFLDTNWHCWNIYGYDVDCTK